MKQVLLNTKDATLVEAGPDTFWVAGVRLHDPRLKHGQWTGQNELGKTCMSKHVNWGKHVCQASFGKRSTEHLIVSRM